MGAWVKTASGIEIPAPAYESGNTIISTFVNAGRNAQGNFIGQIVGNDKMKIEMNFAALSPGDMASLLAIWDRTQGGKFVNTFIVYDPRRQAYVSKQMYVGDRSGKPIMVSNLGTGHPKWWLDVQANLIEV